MIYKDRIYGRVEIFESLLLELIKTPAVQRLKKIEQAGHLEPYFPGTFYSRFEHSMGVFVLLKKYKASLEEQVAGLIHDVSHSVFSHCIDYILDSGSEEKHNHQDNIFKNFVQKTEIPLILKKYGMDLDYILNESNFPLKERELPDLCADRIDYSLRTAVIFKNINQEEVNCFLKNLIIENKYWIFKNFEIAKKYADLFFKLNSLYYAGLPSAVMFRTVGDCMRYALQRGYINEGDLYTTDKEVLTKIGKYLKKDKKLRLLFNKMEGKIGFKENKQNYDSHIFCKSRIVDPLCKYNGKIKRVSEINKEWGILLKKESVPKEYFTKFEE